MRWLCGVWCLVSGCEWLDAFPWPLKPEETADTGGGASTSCAEDFYNGPTAITERSVTCDGHTVRFYARTEGWTSDGYIFSQETGHAEVQWSDEHDLLSYQFDACGFEDHLERILDDGERLSSPLDWLRNESTVFTCASHYEAAPSPMTYAFAVNDLSGNLSDCSAFGDDVEGMRSASYARSNDPSFTLLNCSASAAR